MTRAEWAAQVESLAATRDGLRARLDAGPRGPDVWQLRRDLDATLRAIAFAESKRRHGSSPIEATRGP